MKAEILESLNPGQREAVEYCEGPSLIIAGAGSGKTRVLTHKIAYLLENGYEPWSILALTFTNKAANEMKMRISNIVGYEKARYLWMGTFHSVFLRILRAEHEHIGFSPNFTIYDTADSRGLVKDIVKEMGLDEKIYKPASVLSQISNAKNQLVSAEEYAANPANYQNDVRAKVPALRDIYIRYSNRCRQSDAMDFDDILVYTYWLLDKNPEICRKYAERFRYVLVDEYQDTNFAQHRIVWLLTKDTQKVCVVGDDAQSIYSFRGANIDNILTFKDIYSNSRMFKLEQNYRSTQMIVAAANSLISKNSRQIKKNVFSENESGERISVRDAYSDVEEAQIVIRNIQQLHRKEGGEYSDFAILYRTNAQSRVFEEALRKNGLPYRIYGGLSFYQRKEIKDIIAYFRLAVNPNDEEAFKRVINYPARGIGNTTLSKIVSVAAGQNVSLWDVINDPLEYGLNLSKATATRVGEFRELVASFIEMARSQTAREAGREIVRQSGIIADVYQDRLPENLSRQENVEELMNGLEDFCTSRMEEGNQNILISDYLSEVSLLSDVDTDKGEDEHKVTLMTIHSAKGLEFPTVFVVGLEENLFPSAMAGSSAREMEEERRLFYVAITRAERHCFLSYAKSRYRYGRMEFGTPSRFISDIDPQYLDRGTSAMYSATRKNTDEVELPWKSRRNLFSEEKKSRDMFAEEREARSYREKVESRDEKNSSVEDRRGYKESASPTPSVSPVSSARRLSPISSAVRRPVSSASTASSCLSEIAVGQCIEHERFGVGTVERLEGSGETRKATVNFRNAGTKQLLLKFARFKIVE
ncbi:MAG: UvrD-helicase domain-containing protein [Bacteroides sp.]|nr:UvrD-helicase domain-containing protein [Roseburia sp.]MCM1347576.1 UvrD-helicase domain-containing protein [Bacteroides sp.]MCM1421068.1 UvrD-helicase domain-containing protein [Bacteroides sp.]